MYNRFVIFDCQLRCGHCRALLFFFFNAIPSNSYLWEENRKVLSWIRKPESVILDKETKKSYLTWENPKVLYRIRKLKNLILQEKYKKSYKTIFAQCLSNAILWQIMFFCSIRHSMGIIEIDFARIFDASLL